MLTWIFGGTAVGKKHFIQHRISDDPEFMGCVPSWIEDGGLEPAELEAWIRDEEHRLVRWQWHREHTLAKVAESHPHIKQNIILLTVSPKINFQRAKEREGRSPWAQGLLAETARNVDWLTIGLTTCYDIPLTKIDYS